MGRRGGTAENKPGPGHSPGPGQVPVPVPGPSPAENNRVPESYSLLCGEEGRRGVF